MIYGSNFCDKDEHSHKSSYVSEEMLTDEGILMAIKRPQDGNSR
jgi:hypothetical protein